MSSILLHINVCIQEEGGGEGERGERGGEGGEGERGGERGRERNLMCSQENPQTTDTMYPQTSLAIMDTVSLLYRGVLYVEVTLYSKECNWYTRCCPLNGGVRYRECPLRETILYIL